MAHSLTSESIVHGDVHLQVTSKWSGQLAGSCLCHLVFWLGVLLVAAEMLLVSTLAFHRHQAKGAYVQIQWVGGLMIQAAPLV